MRSVTALPTAARSLLVLFLSLAVLSPVCAQANAGTPMMWAGLLHLTIGNALIGLAEGVLVAWWARLHRGKCVGAMIAANYASAWAGLLLLNWSLVHHFDRTLANVAPVLIVMVVVAFVFTVLVEWPFVAWCIGKSPDRWRRSLKLNVKVQLISYAVLFIWYSMASPISLLTRVDVVPVSELHPSNAVRVMFISRDDGDVYSMYLDGTQRQKLAPLGSTDRNDRLAMQQEGTNWVMRAYLNTTDHKGSIVSLATNLSGRFVEDWNLKQRDGIDGTWFNFGLASSLGDTNGWQFFSGFWPAEGLKGTDTRTGQSLRIALETPFAAWHIRNATKLPDQRVVFQLGEDQICLLDASAKKIALLARGRGPVVNVVDGEAASVRNP